MNYYVDTTGNFSLSSMHSPEYRGQTTTHNTNLEVYWCLLRCLQWTVMFTVSSGQTIYNYIQRNFFFPMSDTGITGVSQGTPDTQCCTTQNPLDDDSYQNSYYKLKKGLSEVRQYILFVSHMTVAVMKLLWMGFCPIRAHGTAYNNTQVQLLASQYIVIVSQY